MVCAKSLNKNEHFCKSKLVSMNGKQKWVLNIDILKKCSEHINIPDDLFLFFFKGSHYVVMLEKIMAWAVMYRAMNSL